MKTTQKGRLLYLETPLGEEYLLINKVTGSEAISELFHYELEMLHEENEESYRPTPIDPKKLLGKPLIVQTKQDDGGERFFNGLCIAFHQGKRDPRFSFYRATIVPDVWLLTKTRQSRIFQNKSVTDILKTVLEGFKFKIEVSQPLNPRNYVVQYRESDWDFISRLMEEEGIFYYFEHKADENRMIIADSPQSHRVCPSKAKLPYMVDISELGEAWVGGVHEWLFESRLQTAKLELRDYNFELQNNTLQSTQTSRFIGVKNESTEFYDYPGGYAKRYDGVDVGGGGSHFGVNYIYDDRERTGRIRQEQMDMEFRTVSSWSDSAALVAGYRFELSHHPMPSNNIQQIVVSSLIIAQQAPAYVTDDDVPDAYLNEFRCMPHGQGHAPFRPQMKTPKPVVAGSQTAIVVGPPGEEIFPDKYGRVKVHFHWDRISQFEPESSCWLRVSTAIAGKAWGTVFIPRVGQEVIVDFIEGDPDQPIITGSVPNPEAMPPYELPKYKTMSTIKTLSSPSGAGFNELRFEDKKGGEQIFVHAEKNVDVRVKNDVMETIIHDRHLIVENDQYEKVKKDKHLTVQGDHNEKITGTMSLTVSSDLQEKVANNYALDAGSVHIKAGMSAVIEAATALTLKVGGNFINIGPAGIFIKGTMVMINSGGMAGTGAGSSPDSPKDPKEADKADPGATNRPGKPLPPHRAVKFSPMALSLQQASQSGTPFCEICSKQNS